MVTYTSIISAVVGFLVTFTSGYFGVRGLWISLFHSVSAFCNAGFDLMGTKGEFSSLI